MNDSVNFRVDCLFVCVFLQSACDSSHCLNGATCQSGFTNKRYRCLCPTGWTGEHCEQGKEWPDSLSFYTVLFAVSQHKFSTTFLLYNQSTIKDIPMLRFSAGNPKLIQMNEYIRYKISDELTFSNISDGKAVL